jgi:hypothetical protein
MPVQRVVVALRNPYLSVVCGGKGAGASRSLPLSYALVFIQNKNFYHQCALNLLPFSLHFTALPPAPPLHMKIRAWILGQK